MSLKTKAKSWLSEGLITEEQMTEILQYEKGSRSGFSYNLYGFLLVALVSAGLGLIALISANWWAIPVFVKLFGYFFLLSGLGIYTIYWFQEKSPLHTSHTGSFWFESFLLFFMILCLAGIGLIAQIYHIEGESYQTLFFWSLITCFIMGISRGSLIFYLWFASLYTASALYLMDKTDSHLLFKLAVLQPLLFLSLTLFFHNKKVVQLFPSLQCKKKVFEEGALLTGILSLILLHTVPRDFGLTEVDLVLLSPLGLLTLCGIYLSGLKQVQKNLLTGILALFVLFYALALEQALDKLGLMIFSVLFLSLFALFFATLKQKKLFTFFVLSLLIRILLFYLEVFKSLTLTGLILILFGFIVFIGVRWIKSKEQDWTKWVEGLK